MRIKPTDKITNKMLRTQRAKRLKCNYCPPNKGCNGKDRPAHGVKKPKYKDKR